MAFTRLFGIGLVRRGIDKPHKAKGHRGCGALFFGLVARSKNPQASAAKP